MRPHVQFIRYNIAEMHRVHLAVIQFIAMGNDHFRHIVMISEVLTDESGNTVDYLICSNTGDLCDFPAGAYFYTYQQLIKIHGWN